MSSAEMGLDWASILKQQGDAIKELENPSKENSTASWLNSYDVPSTAPYTAVPARDEPVPSALSTEVVDGSHCTALFADGTRGAVGVLQSLGDGLPPGIPSVGSLKHAQRLCKPCAFIHKDSTFCRNGGSCQFCHLCPPGEKKNRTKERRHRTQQNPQIVGMPHIADAS
mmetsp:Transcript_25868/g.56230  ORF Transcript_25868/g.56230 Transcript_25868/m.56230 type:complete len:169 (+) Transcript_25868:65-571(+)